MVEKCDHLIDLHGGDLDGQKLLDARAPAAGIVLYICSVPTMTKGGTIANIGVVRRSSRSLETA